MMQSLRRKQQAEENRIRRGEENREKDLEDKEREDEKMRKKEEERARRDAIFEQHKLKKEMEKQAEEHVRCTLYFIVNVVINYISLSRAITECLNR